MSTILAEDFDKLVSQTIRIELKDGSVLIYYVSLEAKKAFQKLLHQESISDHDNEFLWLYIPRDRLVLINRKEIIRITFCFDAPAETQPRYHDNFKLLVAFDKSPGVLGHEENSDFAGEDICLAQLIIKHARHLEDTEVVKDVTMKTEGYFGNISSYSSLSDGDVEGFDFEYFDLEEEWTLLTYKYLTFIDDDGEENYMPLENLMLIEAERELLMSEANLNHYLGRNIKNQRNPKKK